MLSYNFQKIFHQPKSCSNFRENRPLRKIDYSNLGKIFPRTCLEVWQNKHWSNPVVFYKFCKLRKICETPGLELGDVQIQKLPLHSAGNHQKFFLKISNEKYFKKNIRDFSNILSKVPGFRTAAVWEGNWYLTPTGPKFLK